MSARAERRHWALPSRAAMAAAAIAALLAAVVAFALAAAAGPSFLTPASTHGFPAWLAGPLEGIGLTLTGAQFALLMAGSLVAYGIALAFAGALEARWVVLSIVIAQLVVVLAPPVLSNDPFTYLAYARLGAVHGLDPYASVPAAAPTDPVYRFAGWHTTSSAYGPLFTLLTYTFVPLGLAGSLWALKLVTLSASLAVVALVGRCAQRLGREPATAMAFVGLNPVLLFYALGGIHNDLIMLAPVTAGILLVLERREASGGAAVVAAAAVKVSALAVLPFLALGARRPARTLAGAAVTAAAVGAVALAAFGSHALGFVPVIERVSRGAVPESVPAALSQLFGHSVVAPAVRTFAVAASLAVVAVLLVLTWRGADWIAMSGWALLAIVAASTMLLGWYAIWALPLAALSSDRRLKVAAVGFAAYFAAIDIAARIPL